MRVISLDDGRAYPLLADLLLARNARKDAELSEEKLQSLLQENSLKTCLEAAIAALSRRAMAQTELRRFLLSRKHAPAAVDNALAECLRLTLLNDADYAAMYAADMAARGMGRRRILQTLARRGIAREMADSACENLEDEKGTTDGGEEQRARELLAKKCRPINRERVDPKKLRAKLARFLYARGYPADLSFRIIDEYLRHPDVE